MSEDIKEPTDTNIAAAMSKVMETTPLTVSRTVDDDEGTAGTQVLIRATDAEKRRWKEAAEKNGVTLSQFIRECLNQQATNTLDCTHPINHRRYYPWAEFCLSCGLRLRG